MWADQLAAKTKIDAGMRLLVAIGLAAWLWNVGFRLENAYPASLIELYALPLTRIFLLILVLLSAAWCPTVGILAALAYVTLGADVIFFTHGGQALAASRGD
jgi:hypothetical protein